VIETRKSSGIVVGRHGSWNSHQIGLDESPGGVADQFIAQPILDSEDELEIADGIEVPPTRCATPSLSSALAPAAQLTDVPDPTPLGIHRM
jgi:hypothetical protein